MISLPHTQFARRWTWVKSILNIVNTTLIHCIMCYKYLKLCVKCWEICSVNICNITYVHLTIPNKKCFLFNNSLLFDRFWSIYPSLVVRLYCKLLWSWGIKIQEYQDCCWVILHKPYSSFHKQNIETWFLFLLAYQKEHLDH